MPAKDHYHDTVKRALIKDGWKIIREQVLFVIADRRVWIDEVLEGYTGTAFNGYSYLMISTILL